MTNSEVVNPPNPSNPSYSVVHIENPGHSISTVTFNGNNYDDWSRSFYLALMAKGKLGYINGAIKKPSATADSYQNWESTNALVTLWIFNTIAPSVRKQISLRPEAKQVWEDIKNRFCQTNETRVYQLQAELLACRQGPTESLMDYYGRMATIWDAIIEHDSLPKCSCNPCSCDWLNLITSRREKRQVRDFLMGLDSRFSNARSQIIGITPLPQLDVVYNRLLQDEGVRNLSQPKSDTAPDTMAFAARITNAPVVSGRGRDSQTHPRPSSGSSNNSNRTFCLACNRPGHHFQRCYQVTGEFPDWWGERPRDRIFVDPHATDLSKATFVPDVQGRATWDRLRKQGKAGGHPPRAHMAAGNSGQTTVGSTGGSSSGPPLSTMDRLDFNSMSPQQLDEITKLWRAHQSAPASDTLHGNISHFPWIIDTGASHHLSGSLSQFSNIRTISPLSVGLPNGDLTIATKSGDICFSSRLILRNDRSSKRVIGAGEQREGLYYLQGLHDGKATVHTSKTDSNAISVE
ncbi:uncharacterized protein LOC141649294 [Silene latifolia]|uniref:uncharacterized protein LOC141649294 n=1 Tax=Silene latifolia TaxID=37657 RepID=UPI003D76E279